MRIALDAMGGDYAPTNIVSGAILALREYHRISKLFLVGDRDQIIRHLGEQNYEDQRVEVVHTTQVIEMSDRIQHLDYCLQGIIISEQELMVSN